MQRKSKGLDRVEKGIEIRSLDRSFDMNPEVGDETLEWQTHPAHLVFLLLLS